MKARFAMLLSLLVLAATFASPASAQVEFLDEQFTYEESDPAAGSWLGTVSVPQAPGQSFVAGIVIGPAGESQSITINCVPLAALNAACDPLDSGENDIAFKYGGAGLELHFRGDFSDDGQRVTGTVINAQQPEGEDDHGSFELARTPRAIDLDEHMAFTGELAVQGFKLGTTIVLARTPNAHWVGNIDIPLQMLRAFPLHNITETEGVIRAEFAVPGDASIEMSLGALDQVLSGKLAQSGIEIPFEFVRDHNYAFKEVTRPQEPRPPFPYEQRDVVVTHPDGFDIAGTLTIPDRDEFGDGPFPVAVLISGSGQQDRNESLLGHKPFLVLADHLTRHGIAVMRYDDRGVGGSGGLDTVSTATSQDFATDAIAVVNHLKTIEVITEAQIGLIGHSEGGLIAPLVGTMTDDIAFMVLMAGPGVPGRELLDVQRKKLSMAMGMSEADADKQDRMINELIDIILAGGTVDDAVKRAMEINQQDPDPSLASLTDEQLRAAIRSQIEMIANPWMQYFMVFDPAEALRKVNCPVLAINGTLDLQVWHSQNLDAIERILNEAGVDVTAIRYDGFNHLFQKATTGAVSEYSEIETTIEPVVLDDITEWILDRTGGKE